MEAYFEAGGVGPHWDEPQPTKRTLSQGEGGNKLRRYSAPALPGTRSNCGTRKQTIQSARRERDEGFFSAN